MREVADEQRLGEAFYRCLKECEYMPRVKDVLDRLPEQRRGIKPPVGKVTREWTEQIGDGLQVHYYETDAGEKLVRMERVP